MDAPFPMSSLNPKETLRFMELCWQMTPYLDLFRPDPLLEDQYEENHPPLELPTNVAKFFADCLFSQPSTADVKAINNAWQSLSHFIWSMRHEPREAMHLLSLFLKFGPEHDIGGEFNAPFDVINIYIIGFIAIGPPTRFCTDPKCKSARGGKWVMLDEPKTHSAILFTKAYGPLPVFSTSLYCRRECLYRRTSCCLNGFL
jgi:KDZ transposase family protein